MASGIPDTKYNDSSMDVGRLSGLILFFSLTLLLSAAIFPAGCGGDSLAGRLERAGDSIRNFEGALQGATRCLQALFDFDFENASFLDDARSAIKSGQDAVETASQALDDLSSIDFRDKLVRMGELVSGFIPPARQALEELSLFYEELESLLLAVEPLLREEAIITQLEMPRDQAEWRERLERLRQALETTLQALAGLSIDSVLSDYHAYFLEVAAALIKVVEQIINRLPLANLEKDIGVSADFGRVREMLDAYPLVVEGLKERLMIFSLDPLISEIELEINRLYVESGSLR
ncbi:hypothetical protein [Candidatus Solincola sp.]|nr:hypothetical protein [Actinomycetota bacterium]MDI7253432.1 hypothetical protein [Actinomycetota bacterium]